LVNWDGDSDYDECFGIAPSRTIWHAWPGSGRWQEMPNNGRADDMYGWYQENGRNGVAVWVAATDSEWCSTRNAGPGWGAWSRC
jgi:hypothetical protein